MEALSTHDSLSIIWKSVVSDKIKIEHLPECGGVNITVWTLHLDADETWKKLDDNNTIKLFVVFEKP